MSNVTTASPMTTNNTCTEDDAKYGGELTGSLALNGLLIVILIVGTFFLIRGFADRNVHWSYVLIVTIAWVSGFIGTVYLPLDIALTSAEGAFLCCGRSDDTLCSFDWEDDLEIIWTALYWFTFSMTWLFLPVVMEEYNAAEFTFSGRLKFSLCAQVKFYVMGAVAGLVLMGIFIAQDPSEEFQTKLLSAGMALGNAYGLLMVVFLLGDGLVRVPRSLWRSSSAKVEEGRLCSRAGDAHVKLTGDKMTEKLKATFRKVVDAHLQIQYDKEEDKFGEYMQTIMAPILRLRAEQTHAERHADSVRDPQKRSWIELDRTKRSSTYFWTNLDTDDEKMRKLVELHRETRAITTYLFRRRGKWLDMVSDFRFYKDILQSENGEKTDDESFRPTVQREPLQCMIYWMCCASFCCCVSPKVFVLRVRKVVLRFVAIVLMAFSLIIVAAEVTLPVSGQQSLFGYAVKEASEKEMGVFIFTFLAFGYMSVCTYVSFVSLSLPIPGTDVNARNIVPNNLTSPYALMLFGTYICRMQFALGYHFLNIMQYNGEPENLQPSAFKRLYMANGDVSGLGLDWFFAVFPIGVAVMFFLCLSNAYSYCMVCSGMGSPDDEVNVEGVSSSTLVLAGRGLLRSEAKAQKRVEERQVDSCCWCLGLEGKVTYSTMVTLELNEESSAPHASIQIGQLKQRDSWTPGSKEDDDDDVSTRESASKRNKKSKRVQVDAHRRFKVGSLKIKGSTSFFGTKFVEYWAEVDTVEKTFKWWEGDDKTGVLKGDVFVHGCTLREVDNEESTFELIDGAKTYRFTCETKDDMYTWMKAIRFCLGIRSPSVSRRSSYAAKMKQSKSAVLFMEEKSFFGSSTKARYVVLNLETKVMKWYDGQTDHDKLLGTLDLVRQKVRIRRCDPSEVSKKMEHSFDLVPETESNVSYRFATPNKLQNEDWVDVLTTLLGRPAAPSGGGDADHTSVSISTNDAVESKRDVEGVTDALDDAFDEDDEDDVASSFFRQTASKSTPIATGISVKDPSDAREERQRAEEIKKMKDGIKKFPVVEDDGDDDMLDDW